MSFGNAVALLNLLRENALFAIKMNEFEEKIYKKIKNELIIQEELNVYDGIKNSIY